MQYLAQISSQLILAQAIDSSEPSQLAILGGHLLAVAVFSAMGIIVLIGGLLVVEKLTPFSLRQEILEEHNTAAAMILSAIVLGMSIIIAASVVG